MFFCINFQAQAVASKKEQKRYDQSNQEQEPCIQCEDGHEINAVISKRIADSAEDNKDEVKDRSLFVAKGKESDVADGEECKG